MNLPEQFSLLLPVYDRRQGLVCTDINHSGKDMEYEQL